MTRKKKKGYPYLRVFLLLCFFAVATFTVVTLFFVRPHIFYPGFEISIPAGYEIHGIDVSRYQQTINWEEVKSMESKGVKIGFAFIKATEGITRSDRQFKRNWKGSYEQRIARGAYHFFVPGRDPALQAKNFIKHVTLSAGDMPPVLDIEQPGRLSVEQIQNDAKAWLNIVENHYGVTPIIYTNISFYTKYFKEGFEKYPLWIAHYLEPHQPRISKKWIIWQHSETGRVNGIRSPVDFNVFYGDSADFKNILYKK